MRNLFKRNNRRNRINWLELDSWLDSSLYESWESVRNFIATLNSFFARFRVTGTKRIIVECLSEMTTLGTGAAVVMLALALPAFEATNEAWQAKGSFSVTFLDRYGNEIGKRGILHDDAVPLEEIPDHMIKATMATEDRRFFDHFGIDVFGTARALVENIRANDVVQGGSSLTQQLAKNLFLTSERSLERKVKEAFLAIWLEFHMSKEEILKLYLDRAYMGGGAFGVEAASQFYFNKSVRDINLAEAAMLAGLYKAPTKYAPHVSLTASRKRANEVLSNMVEAGYMTEGQVHGARLNPAKIVRTVNASSPDWYLDWAFEEVKRIMQDSTDFVLTAQTTIDTQLQKHAENAIKKVLKDFGRAKRTKQGALVSMELDGAVRTIVGGRDYGESQFNRATKARRQPGSSFKPYVYYMGLEDGLRPNSIVTDSYVSCGRWSPKNYAGGYRGRMTLATALKKSINTVAVKISLNVGRDNLLKKVHQLGLKNVKKTCSMALGDTGITPLLHTAGFAHFANGGKSVKPYAILEIRNSSDDVVYNRETDEPKPRQILNRRKVEQLNSMLDLVTTSGTGRRAQLEFTPTAGKTGTSSSYRDAWFMGFTGKYVTGVWFGNDDFSPTGGVTGGNMPAIAWQQYMNVAHGNQNIPPIPGVTPYPNQRPEPQDQDPDNFGPDIGPTPQQVVRGMSRRTRQVLLSMGKLFKDSLPIDAAADKASKKKKAQTTGSLNNKKNADL